VFLGLGAGLGFKFLFGWLAALPAHLNVAVPGLLKARVGIKMSAALFGVGYILGPRIASIMVAGGLLSSLVIIPGSAYWGAEWSEPYFPETELTIAEMSASQIWNRYVRYIGAGAVAAAGLITLIRSIPVMVASFRLGAPKRVVPCTTNNELLVLLARNWRPTGAGQYRPSGSSNLVGGPAALWRL
jgi:uncharacterized oligopeptide transporter (OPT) family protein